MLRRVWARLGTVRRFVGTTTAVAGIEFALVLPILLVFMLMGTELVRYINTARKLTDVARSMADMIATNTSGSITETDIHVALNSVIVLFPQVLRDSFAKNIVWYADIQSSLASIKFTPLPTNCTSNCTYTASAAWTSGTNSVYFRPCSSSISSAPDTAIPTAGTLPADVFGSGTLIVADVSYAYTPTFGKTFFPSITIRRTAYLQPRYVAQVAYVPVNFWDPVAKTCP